ANAALAGIAIRLAGFFGSSAIGFELFDRAIAAIRFRIRDQLLGALAISIETIALIDRTFVPLDAEPLQRRGDLLGVMLSRTLDIGVFDAQQHRAAVATGVKKIEDRGPRAADVEEARRRRSEAEFHGGGSLARLSFRA